MGRQQATGYARGRDVSVASANPLTRSESNALSLGSSLPANLNWDLDVLAQKQALPAIFLADVVQSVCGQCGLAPGSRGHLCFKVDHPCLTAFGCLGRRGTHESP